jgi:hypothetical protein
MTSTAHVIWQLYDWYLRPHAGYYFAKKANESIHIQLNLDDMSVAVFIKLRMTNPSKILAFFVNPSVRKGKDGQEILPSFWSDNYFSILPGRSKDLEVEFLDLNIKGEEIFLKLEGWNISPQMIKIDH